MRFVYMGFGRLGFRAKFLIGLVLVLATALITLLALLALSIALVGLPILLAVGLVYALLPRRRMAPAKRQSSEPDVLEGRFRVLDSDRHLRGG
jgi:hypothetical protein